MNITPIDDPVLVQTATRFAALGSEQRLSVLRALVRAGPEGLAIGDLGARVGLAGSTLTHHLKTLADADLIRQTRSGRRILCHGAFDQIEALSAFLLSECCADTACTPHDHGAPQNG